MFSTRSLIALSSILHLVAATANFTILNGQIYTPGLAIVDAPQPGTPLGGDFLEVALDVSGNGRLPMQAYQLTNVTTPLVTTTITGDAAGATVAPGPNSDLPTAFRGINIFLWSKASGFNLTVANGTTNGWLTNDHGGICNATSARSNNSPDLCMSTPILQTEAGSTVKHVRFAWPECFVGNPSTAGAYNISIHQAFRANGTEYYTIFDLPIGVTNSIPEKTAAGNGKRLSCESLNNGFVEQKSSSLAFQPWVASGAYLQGVGGEGNSASPSTTTVAGAAPSAGVGARIGVTTGIVIVALLIGLVSVL